MKGAFGTAGYACGHFGPKFVAEVTFRVVVGVLGAVQRSLPVVGAAYRILEHIC